jgi:acyl carrier protein
MIRDFSPYPEGWTRTNPRLAEDLEYHSLALVELAFALEEEFDLPPLEQDDVRSIRTVDDVTDYVLSHLGERTGSDTGSPVRGESA